MGTEPLQLFAQFPVLMLGLANQPLATAYCTDTREASKHSFYSGQEAK